MKTNRVAIGLALAVAALLAVLAYETHEGNKGMERAANSVGTTTQTEDKNALANQGSTPPGNAAAIGGTTTK